MVATNRCLQAVHFWPCKVNTLTQVAAREIDTRLSSRQVKKHAHHCRRKSLSFYPSLIYLMQMWSTKKWYREEIKFPGSWFDNCLIDFIRAGVKLLQYVCDQLFTPELKSTHLYIFFKHKLMAKSIPNNLF